MDIKNYCKGDRIEEYDGGSRQLRMDHNSVQHRLKLIYECPSQQFGTGVETLLQHYFSELGRVLIHQPFGLCLRTQDGSFQTLVPKLRRKRTDWTIYNIGLDKFHIGILFGAIYCFAHITTQRIVFYIPPIEMSLSELIDHHDLSGFKTFTIERSIPNWTGHVASMAPILAVVATLVKNLQIVFQRMGAAIINDKTYNVLAGAELLNEDRSQFVNSFLTAIDAFLV